MKRSVSGWIRPGFLLGVLTTALTGCAEKVSNTSSEEGTSAPHEVVMDSSVASVLEGGLEDGTAYRIDIPADWNGTLLLDLDHASRMGDRQDPVATVLLNSGYGLAGTTRANTGWAVHESVENLMRVADLASDEFGTPESLIAYGSSLGGHTAMVATQRYPDRFAGGISLCMSPAGAVGVWNGKLDALFVARTLLAPDAGLPIMDVPRDFAETALPAWQKTLSEAQQTPEGRARIALAAVMGQLPDWSMPDKPIPDPGDFQARQEGLYDSLSAHRLPLIGQAMSSRYQLSELAGGNISWNAGFDYRQALNRLEGRKLVEALYEQAGLSLNADLEALARAPRIEADAEALDYMAPQIYSGDLDIPILTLHATGDQVAPIDSVQAFAQSVEDAGKSGLLSQVYTRAAGHCPFSVGETVALVEVMKERLSRGNWPGMSAASMNERAGRIGGEARYIDYEPEVYLRPFDQDDLEAGRFN